MDGHAACVARRFEADIPWTLFGPYVRADNDRHGPVPHPLSIVWAAESQPRAPETSLR
jgi:hypothetical protein